MYINEESQQFYEKDGGLDIKLCPSTGTAVIPPASGFGVVVKRTAIVDHDDREGAWMQGFTGQPFWPCDPNVADIDLETIAHALAHQCRFGGHTTQFYSVAEHCYRASLFQPEQFAFEKLMHDASEAYLQDIPRPIKRGMNMDFYNQTEDKWHKVLAYKYGFKYPYPEPVKIADEVMLHCEARDLMATGPWQDIIDWKFLNQFKDLPKIDKTMPPEVAKLMWLKRFAEVVYPRR